MERRAATRKEMRKRGESTKHAARVLRIFTKGLSPATWTTMLTGEDMRNSVVLIRELRILSMRNLGTLDLFSMSALELVR